MNLSHPARARGARWLIRICPIAALIQAGPAAALTISEVLYDASGSDNGQVFVELYGAPGTDLAGFTLEGVNGADGAVSPVLSLSGLIPADGFFVVADDDAGSTLVPNADLLLNFDLQNGPDSVALRDSGSVLLDALGYGDFPAGTVFAGEGTPAPDPPAGSSLARVFANVDTDDNAADFSVLSVPTPGSGAVIPEPGSGLLLAGALCGLSLVRRRSPERAGRTT